jgi:hypothetical protein
VYRDVPGLNVLHQLANGEKVDMVSEKNTVKAQGAKMEIEFTKE